MKLRKELCNKSSMFKILSYLKIKYVQLLDQVDDFHIPRSQQTKSEKKMIDDSSKQSAPCTQSCCQLMMTKYAHLLEQMDDPLTQSESIRQPTGRDMHPHKDKRGKHLAQQEAMDKELVVGTRGVLKLPHHLLDEVVKPHTERESIGQPNTKDMHSHDKRGKHLAQQEAMDKELVVGTRGVLKVPHHLLDEVVEPRTESKSIGQPTTKDMHSHKKGEKHLAQQEAMDKELVVGTRGVLKLPHHLLDEVVEPHTERESIGQPTTKDMHSHKKGGKHLAQQEAMDKELVVGTRGVLKVPHHLLDEPHTESKSIGQPTTKDMHSHKKGGKHLAEQEAIDKELVVGTRVVLKLSRHLLDEAVEPHIESESIGQPTTKDMHSHKKKSHHVHFGDIDVIYFFDKSDEEAGGPIPKRRISTRGKAQGETKQEVLCDVTPIQSKPRPEMKSKGTDMKDFICYLLMSEISEESSAKKDKSPVQDEPELIQGNNIKEMFSDSNKICSELKKQNLNSISSEHPYQLDNADRTGATIDSSPTQEESAVGMPFDVQSRGTQTNDGLEKLPQQVSGAIPKYSKPTEKIEQVRGNGFKEVFRDSNETFSESQRQNLSSNSVEYHQLDNADRASATRDSSAIQEESPVQMPCDVLYGGTVIANSPASGPVQECSAPADESQQVQLEDMQQISRDKTETTSKPRHQRVMRKTRDVDNAHTSSATRDSSAIQEESPVQMPCDVLYGGTVIANSPASGPVQECSAPADESQQVQLEDMQQISRDKTETTSKPRHQRVMRKTRDVDNAHTSSASIESLSTQEESPVQGETQVVQGKDPQWYHKDNPYTPCSNESVGRLARLEDVPMQMPYYIQRGESASSYIPDQSGHQPCGCIPGYHLYTDKIQLAQGGDMQHVHSESRSVRWYARTGAGDHAYQGDNFVRSSPSVSFGEFAAQEDSSVEMPYYLQRGESASSYIPDQSGHQPGRCIPGYHQYTDKIQLAKGRDMQQVLSNYVDESPESSSRRSAAGTRAGDHACQGDNFVRSSPSVSFGEFAAQEDSSVEMPYYLQRGESASRYIPDQSRHQPGRCIPGYHQYTDKIQLAKGRDMQQVLSNYVDESPESSSRRSAAGTRAGDHACQGDNFVRSSPSVSFGEFAAQEDSSVEMPYYLQRGESASRYIPDQSRHQPGRCIPGYHQYTDKIQLAKGRDMQQVLSNYVDESPESSSRRSAAGTRAGDHACQGDNFVRSSPSVSFGEFAAQEDSSVEMPYYLQRGESASRYIPDQSRHQPGRCIPGYHQYTDKIQLAKGRDMQQVLSNYVDESPESSSRRSAAGTRAGDHACQGDNFVRSSPSVSFGEFAAQEDSSVEMPYYLQRGESASRYIPDQSRHQPGRCIPGYHQYTDKIQLAQGRDMQQVLSNYVEESPESSSRRSAAGTRAGDHAGQGDNFVRSSPSVSFGEFAAQEDSSVEMPYYLQRGESASRYIPDQSGHQPGRCIPGYHQYTDKIQLAQGRDMQQVLSNYVEESPESSSRRSDAGTRAEDHAGQGDNFVRSRSSKPFRKTQKTKIFTNTQWANRFSSENSDLSEEESHSQEQSQYQEYASCDEYSHSTEQSSPYSDNIQYASTQSVSPRPSSNYTDNVYPHSSQHDQEPPSSVHRNQLTYYTNNQIRQTPSTDGYSYNMSSVGEHRENNKGHAHYARLCPQCRQNYIDVVINKCRVCNYQPNIVAADQFPIGVHLPEYFNVNCRFTRFNEMG